MFNIKEDFTVLLEKNLVVQNVAEKYYQALLIREARLFAILVQYSTPIDLVKQLTNLSHEDIQRVKYKWGIC